MRRLYVALLIPMLQRALPADAAKNTTLRERAIELAFDRLDQGSAAGATLARLFINDLVQKTDNFATTSWAGVPIWQNVLDLWTIQETISEIRPALLIETGTNRGGAALFYAHLMDALGNGRVVTIDIAAAERARPPADRRSCTAAPPTPEIVERVRGLAEAADGPVMVILDGDHGRDHVAEELELYSPFVTPGSLLLSQDGIIDKLGMFRDSRPGPLRANRVPRASSRVRARPRAQRAVRPDAPPARVAAAPPVMSLKVRVR